jgi:hypothetical protein
MLPKIRGQREKHPSGRPQPERNVKSANFGNNYSEKPVTPGLRRNTAQNAIGFIANLVIGDDEPPRSL